MTDEIECPTCRGEGWVYEADETVPFGDGRKPLGPGVLCPVCMGGITFADPENERARLAKRRPARSRSALASR